MLCGGSPMNLFRGEISIAWPIWAGGYPQQGEVIALLEENRVILKKQIEHHVRSRFAPDAGLESMDFHPSGYIRVDGLDPARAQPNGVIVHTVLSSDTSLPNYPEVRERHRLETTEELQRIFADFCQKYIKDAWRGANIFDVDVISSLTSKAAEISEPHNIETIFSIISIIVGAFAASSIVGGVLLVYLGASGGDTAMDIFGNRITTSNAGVAAIGIGALALIIILRRIVQGVERMTRGVARRG
jgi:hypothetical protein